MRVKISAVCLSVVVFLSFLSTLQAGVPSARMDNATHAHDPQGARNDSSGLDAHRAQGSQRSHANESAPATRQLDLHAERLQPFYIMMFSAFLKTVGTAIVFRMDSLRPVEELREEWSRTDLTSQLKRLVGVGFQLLFALMAVNTAFHDFLRLKRFASCTDSWWRIYTYYVLIAGTSTNLVAAFSIALPLGEAERVLDAAGASSRDPRRFGVLLRVKFYLTLWYGRLLVTGMVLVSLPALLTHGIAGLLIELCFAFLFFWEVGKFFFWFFWKNLFTCNWSGLQKDAADAFWFSYAYFIMVGALALSIVSTVIIGWWHGKEIVPLDSWIDYLEGKGRGDVWFEEVEVYGNPGDEPHGAPAPLTDDIQSGQEVGRKTLDSRKVSTFHNRAISCPAALGIAYLLAVRVYRWEGKNLIDTLYTAFSRTVRERTLAAYMEYLQATLSDASASALGTVSAAIDALWALV